MVMSGAASRSASERLGPVAVEPVVHQHDLGDAGLLEHGAGPLGQPRGTADQGHPRECGRPCAAKPRMTAQPMSVVGARSTRLPPASLASQTTEPPSAYTTSAWRMADHEVTLATGVEPTDVQCVGEGRSRRGPQGQLDDVVDELVAG